jgi:hypothetical protein
MDARDAAEHLDPSIDPYEYVISANLHRRHLTGEQKRELIDKVLKAKPEASDSQIAKQTKTSDKTVAKRRRKLESTSEIPRLEKTVGKDGKKRGRPPKRKAGLSPPRPARPLDPYAVGDACVVPSMEAESAPARATGSAEISIEQRRAEMAQLGEDGRSAAPIFEEMDLVDSALAYLAMMDPQQRDRFFKKCTELYGAVIETPHDDAERRSPSPPINVEIGPEHKIPDDLSVPDFLRRVPA